MSKARDTLDALSLTNAPDDGKQYVRKYDNWEEAPVTGYALLDFGTVTINNRYVQDNPFGNDTPALCLLEIFHNNKWSDPEWIWSAGGWGTAVQFVSGEGIVVVTGNRYIAYNSQESGGAHTGTFSLTHRLSHLAHPRLQRKAVLHIHGRINNARLFVLGIAAH